MTKQNHPATAKPNRFKFRAWVEELDFMILSDRFDEHPNFHYGFNEDGELSCGALDEHDDWRDALPMQSTGLPDKNGIEVFEGDIIKDNQGRVMSIIWVDDPEYTVQGLFQFKAIENPVKNFKYASFGSWWNQEYKCLNIEIIGNIHQNPELLKGGE